MLVSLYSYDHVSLYLTVQSAKDNSITEWYNIHIGIFIKKLLLNYFEDTLQRSEP